MGEVYRAKDTRLDRIVAIKVLSAHLSARPVLRERFVREARAVSALKHANICVLNDVGHDQGDDFLVLEFLEGESLAARLDKGSLPLDLVLRYAIEIAGALDWAHRQGVVHRDLKPGNVIAPIWSPDGKWIAFASLRKGEWGIYRKASDNTGSEELLYETPNPTAPTGWTPDRQSLVFWTNSAKTGQDLWLLRLAGDRQAVPFLATERSENSGQVSADGRWITYSSNGAPPTVWVESFPVHGAKWQVAEIAGRSRWRGDGKELFYLTRGRELAAVAVESSGAALRFGTPNSLFRTVLSPANDRIPFYSYDVSADGQRFLIPSAAMPDSGTETKLNVVLNWTAGLKR
jgi:protein kinase-like protein/WD40 repeat protein